MKKVLICVTNDLVTDQRVDKVARTLLNNGFEPVLIGRLLKDSQSLDRPYKTRRFRLLFNNGAAFYACYNLRLFIKLLFTRVDIILSNDLDTLLACYMASTIRKKRLVYDSHELFTEVPELIGRNFQRNAWAGIEKFIVPKLRYTYTVCGSIADIYKEKYGTKFSVVRNIPVLSESTEEKHESNTPYIIYQGVLNVGRGLELMIESMKYAEGYKLIIAGGGDIEDKLHKQADNMNVTDKVVFTGRLKPSELLPYTQGASLGLSLEEDMGLNYRYALPNKLFNYVHANIPVLVSDLPEMSKVVTEYKIGSVLTDRNPQYVAKVIQSMLSDKEQYSEWVANTEKASGKLCWENEEEEILKKFK